MKDSTPVKKGEKEYPDSTKGSEFAAQIRSEANGLTDVRREDLFDLGMRLIYGGQPPAKQVRTRH